MCILLLNLSKQHKYHSANQQYYHTYTAFTVYCISAYGWRLKPRPSLFNKNRPTHYCSRYYSSSVKVERDFLRRSPAIAGCQQQHNNYFRNIRHREQFPVFHGSFRYHLATHCILCQVQVISHFLFVHRGLRTKTVQLTCSVFPTYLIS